eukprot:TRINITY_DN19447_c0_g1_i1.p1 TRINITY_DN19447_c0_g1~~TRINITY_DN19447_c0_g1_i1.p1  ORF type:complete len:207 (-),score=66.35 TRINITY_DN19447_c0_g1_i1:190-810(-)
MLASLKSTAASIARPNLHRRVLTGIATSAAVASVFIQPSTAYAAEKVAFYGKAGTKQERTFIAVKPDGVQRKLVGEIISRFEAKGYKLVALKMIWPTKEQAEKHYADLSDKPFFPGTVQFLSSGPIVGMVWEGEDVIKGGRKMIGATNPKASDLGTIRGDLGLSVGRNLIHGSDSPESAKDEISLWFKEGEVSNWDSDIAKWVYEN